MPRVGDSLSPPSTLTPGGVFSRTGSAQTVQMLMISALKNAVVLLNTDQAMTLRWACWGWAVWEGRDGTETRLLAAAVVLLAGQSSRAGCASPALFALVPEGF